MPDGFAHFARGKGGGTAAVGTRAGKQIRGHRDVSGFGDLVGEILHPIRHAEDFVNHQHHGGFPAGFRIGNEGFDVAAVVLDRNPLPVPRGFVYFLTSPVLRGERESP